MPLNKQRITELTNSIGRSRVLVLGDTMLDEYLLGTVARISPEAPVPVVDIDSTRRLLGGAANVAANIKALGDEPLLVGAVGDDDAANRIRTLLESKEISSDSLVVDKSRRTTIKTRVIAHSQQVVRADQETRHDLDAEIESQVYAKIEKASDDISAIIVSDYGKGMITQSLLQKVIDLCIKKNIFIAVDPKETRFSNYKRVSLITPNHHEAGFAYGRRIYTEEDLLDVGQGLLDRLDAKAILITRGAEGMSLFRREFEPTHIPTFARQVYDVTGAGDTVIAVYVSSVAAGADAVEAAIIANIGAGYTVAQVGTAAVTTEQLRINMERNFDDGKLAAAFEQKESEKKKTSRKS
jgi:D-beta-D-heptose 7-phosphate kinase/D-beta-D-heptose 1-phosphate adenosyltransferase